MFSIDTKSVQQKLEYGFTMIVGVVIPMLGTWGQV